MSRHLQRGFLGAVMLVLASQTLWAPPPAQGQAAAADAKAAAQGVRSPLGNRPRSSAPRGRPPRRSPPPRRCWPSMQGLARGRCRSGRLAGLAGRTPGRARGLRGGESGPARALDILRKRRGESEWRVVDARQVLEDVERLAAMDRDRRPVWPRRTGSTERSRTCTDPANTPKPFLRLVRPWRSARRCWASATPTPPKSLNNLALLLKAQGDYAAAKLLLEQALAIHKAVLWRAPPRHRPSA